MKYLDSASYQQVTGKLNYEAKTPLQMRQLKIDHFGVKHPASYQQVTGKLKYKANPQLQLCQLKSREILQRR